MPLGGIAMVVGFRVVKDRIPHMSKPIDNKHINIEKYEKRGSGNASRYPTRSTVVHNTCRRVYSPSRHNEV